MSITGDADATGGHADEGGRRDQRRGHRAVRARSAILAGLLAREREGTAGSGQRIDISLLESTLAVLVNQAQNAFVTGRAPARRGNAHPNIVPYETFATADGELAVAVGSERQWPRFCEALGVAELAADPRFLTNADRVAHRDVLRPLLEARFATRPTTDWLAALDQAEVPCGPIRDVVEAFAAPQAQARGMTVEIEHPAFGALRQVGIPLTFSRTPGSIRTAPPLLGEHTASSSASSATTTLRSARWPRPASPEPDPLHQGATMTDDRERWALILGASSGMGEATALALARGRLPDLRHPPRLPRRRSPTSRR